MKTFKKLGSLAIALAIVLSTMLVSASAATFTVNGSTVGAEYNAYEVFELTHVDSDSDGVIDSGEPVSYSIDSTSLFYDTVSTFATAENGLVLNQVGSTTKYNVSFTANYTITKAAALAVALTNDSSKPTPTDTQSVTSGTSVVLSGLENGYFLITTTTGANPMLYTVGTANMTKNEKNNLPTIEKAADKTSASIGDTVNFTIEVVADEGAQNYVVDDVMSAGYVWDAAAQATIKVQMAVYDEGTSAYETATDVDAEDYTLTPEANGFNVVFKNTYLDSLGMKDKLIISYSAKLDTDASVGTSGNMNTATLTYGTGSLTKDSSVLVKTFEFPVFKYTGTDTALAGATFKLSTDAAGAYVVKFDDITVVPNAEFRHNAAGTATAFTTATDCNAEFTLTGLAAGTYYLTETAAPDGYNQLEDPITVVIAEDGSITQDGNGATRIEVQNNTGALMPETGGIGTTIFYTVGGLLVAGAGILLITKKRMSAEN